MKGKRLALGTVQFGVPYGLANPRAPVAPDEVAAILAHARAAGVDTVDTAIGYGESERVLGEAGVEGWRVVTKLPGIPSGTVDIQAWVELSVGESLRRLRIQSLYGLLLHRPRELLGTGGGDLYRALCRVRDRGLVQRIGVSVYSPEDIGALCSKFELGLVQAPFSVLDRRLEFSGWLARLSEKTVEVHVRSVFLQGLLLMDHGTRPERFARWQPLWEAWHRWLLDAELTPVRACLGFALAHPEIGRVVVGVDGLAQLKDIIAATDTVDVRPPVELAGQDPDLIDPSRWGRLS